VGKEKPTSAPESKWLAFVTSLPTDDPAARMRVLRTLESLGCAMLREGVYLLPNNNEATVQGLQRLAEHISRINGAAHLLRVSCADDSQDRHFRRLFDRSWRYKELIRTVESLKAGFGISDPASLTRVLAKQVREYDAISALDFFPSQTRDLAAQALRDTGDQVRSMLFPDAPRGSSGALGAQPGQLYFQRVWATRKPLWADRIASAWMIRRFIDPEATLVWLDKTQACPATAVSFGFEGATFSSSKSGITFEHLLTSFTLDKDGALARICALVRYLDTGGTPVAEAAGVDMLLQGARRRSENDDALFSECEKTFDLLYDAYLGVPVKT
jgi:hypothetical protein